MRPPASAQLAIYGLVHLLEVRLLLIMPSSHLQNWHQNGRYFSYRSYRIFYCDEGTKEPLLCVHGFPTASWDWHRLWPELTKHFRVIAPDMIGFGFSDKPQTYSYSINDQAELHQQLLRELNLDSVHVLAHDYGVTVAQELLARDIEQKNSKPSALRLKSVCLLNGGLFPEATHPRLIQKLLASPLGFLMARAITEKRFGRSFSAIFGPATGPTQAELNDFWELINYNGGMAITHKLIRYMAERKQYRDRWVGALQQTRVPRKLINGTADPVSGASIVNRYRLLISNADITELANIGHYPQLENAPEVFRAFISFYRQRVQHSEKCA